MTDEEQALWLKLSAIQIEQAKLEIEWLKETENLGETIAKSMRWLKEATKNAGFKKCARCWKYEPEVGTNKYFPDLCMICIRRICANDEWNQQFGLTETNLDGGGASTAPNPG